MKTMILKGTTIALALFMNMADANTTNNISNPKKQTIRVALLLDTSNSMDGLINQAKAQLWEIVNELSYAKYGMRKPDLEIALYEYGNASLSPKEGYIRQVLQFSKDLDEISEKLFSLKTNGGNEFCGQVIQTSLDELDWGTNKNDLRLLFIAGNEPFTQGKINYQHAIANAQEKDIVVNTIFCGNYQQGVAGMWKDGALSGGGEYMTINHNKKIVHIITPYDTEILLLNKKLNATYIYYGNIGASKFKVQYDQDTNAETLDEVVVVKRAVSKSSRLYNNATWDLVDAAKEKQIDYTKIKKNRLPKYLQNKSAQEIQKYVIKQAKKRKEIQFKIKELDKKRRKHIAKNQKKNKNNNELEGVLIKVIKKQAARKNYSW